MAYTKLMAFKEALSDTGLAFPVNVPLNFLLVALAFRWEFTAFQTSVMLTSIFTVFAIVRKTYVRLYFNDKNLKKQAKKASTT